MTNHTHTPAPLTEERLGRLDEVLADVTKRAQCMMCKHESEPAKCFRCEGHDLWEPDEFLQGATDLLHHVRHLQAENERLRSAIEEYLPRQTIPVLGNMWMCVECDQTGADWHSIDHSPDCPLLGLRAALDAERGDEDK